MKYNFNIVLNGTMEANSEIELIEKLGHIISRNPAFQQIEEVFAIRIDRNSIISEEDDVIFDKIAEDFNLEKEEIVDEFYGFKIEKELLTHEIAVDGTGSPAVFKESDNA